MFGGCRDVDASVHAVAAETGRLLAGDGLHLVYGGGTTGPVGTCARAAAAAGGRVTAVTLEGWLEPGEPAQEIVLAGSLPERTVELERRGRAYLVLPGGLGTLAELFSVWAGRLGGLHDRRIVVLDPEDSYVSVWWAIAQRVEGGAVPADALQRGLRVTRTASAAAAAVLAGVAPPTVVPAADRLVGRAPLGPVQPARGG